MHTYIQGGGRLICGRPTYPPRGFTHGKVPGTLEALRFLAPWWGGGRASRSTRRHLTPRLRLCGACEPLALHPASM
jgi:hypothetical protein